MSPRYAWCKDGMILHRCTDPGRIAEEEEQTVIGRAKEGSLRVQRVRKEQADDHLPPKTGWCVLGLSSCE
jgi:hypothetical protein